MLTFIAAYMDPEMSFVESFLAAFIAMIILLGCLVVLTASERAKSHDNLKREKESDNLHTASFLKLVDYCRREINEGVPKERLKRNLLFEGWNEYLVDKALNKVAYIKKKTKKNIEDLL